MLFFFFFIIFFIKFSLLFCQLPSTFTFPPVCDEFPFSIFFGWTEKDVEKMFPAFQEKTLLPLPVWAVSSGALHLPFVIDKNPDFASA